MSIIELAEKILKKDYVKELRKLDGILINNNIEIWKPIAGYDNYKVSNMGRVNNIKTGRILKNQLTIHGYFYVDLHDNIHKKHITIHRLVAKAFIPNPNNKRCVDHIDNDILNNNVSNLQYATLSENQQNRSSNKNNTSGVKGISYYKKYKKWEARIMINGKTKHLGYFTNIEEAKEARQQTSKLYFGEFQNSCEKS